MDVQVSTHAFVNVESNATTFCRAEAEHNTSKVRHTGLEVLPADSQVMLRDTQEAHDARPINIDNWTTRARCTRLKASNSLDSYFAAGILYYSSPRKHSQQPRIWS